MRDASRDEGGGEAGEGERVMEEKTPRRNRKRPRRWEEERRVVGSG